MFLVGKNGLKFIGGYLLLTKGDFMQKKIEQKLNKIEQAGFLNKELIDFIGKVILIQQDYVQEEIDLPAKLDLDNYKRGVPLLPREQFIFPLDKVKEIRKRLIELTKEIDSLSGDIQSLLQDLEKEGFWEKSLHKYLAGDDSFFRIYGEKMTAAPRLLSFIVQSSVNPFAESISKAIALTLPGEDYTYGHCPICGSLPFLSVLEKGGKRYNICSFCLHQYPVPRLQCVFCLEDVKKEHNYFEVKELPGYRVDVCESCKKYIKTLDFRERDEVIIPPLDDLASLPLDFLAKKEGYLRPTLSFWGF